MPRTHLRGTALLLCLLGFWQTGCHRGATGSTFLSLFGLKERPVVVALVAQVGVMDPFTPHEELRKAMSASIKRPVRLDLCLPMQLAPNLQLGFYDFAIVPPSYYVEMSNHDRYPIVAATVDDTGRVSHPAVLVVPTGSPIQTIEELRGKKVGFGPSTDARTHHAGMHLLNEHGIAKKDLSLALLPVPGSLWHYPTMRDVALAIQNGSVDAGFIDEEKFDLFAAHSDLEGEPARDQLRIIGRTKPVPDLLVIQSPKTKPEIVTQVQTFLLAAGKEHPEALRPLLLTAYEKPSAELCAWSEEPTEIPATDSKAAEESQD